MRFRPILTVLAAATMAAVAAEAHAQLFGSRTLGTTSSSSTLSKSRPSGASDAGSASIRQRFLSDYFGEDDFVGAGSGDQRGFVGARRLFSSGASQPSTSSRNVSRSRTSTPTVRVERAPDANRSLQSTSAKGALGKLYSPRLAVGFGQPGPAPSEVSRNLARQLAISLTGHLASAFAVDPTRRIEVSLADGKATLRGSVSSEHEKMMAGLLALFEPGISEVENQLQVGHPTQPARPAEARDRALKPTAPRTAPAGTPAGP